MEKLPASNLEECLSFSDLPDHDRPDALRISTRAVAGNVVVTKEF
jgi:hypothetical protein